MHGQIKWLIIVIWTMCCIFLASCGNSGGGQQLIAFQTVQKGSVPPKTPNNPIITPTIFVIRSATEWTDFRDLNFQSTLSSSVLPSSLPSINFNENLIIAVVDSVQKTGGHTITITGVVSSPTGVIVQVVENFPGQNCGGVGAALDQPFHIITTSTFSGAATLNLTQTVTDCR